MEWGFLLVCAGLTALWAMRREGRRLQAESDAQHIAWAEGLPAMPDAHWAGGPLTRGQQRLAKAYTNARHSAVAQDRRAGAEFLQEVLFS
jgi:hypothetical protein